MESTEKILDYEKLKKCLESRMPKEYMTGNVIYSKHSESPGKKPVMYRYYNRKKNIQLLDYTIKTSLEWLPRYLWRIAESEERHLLPAALTTIFMQNYIGFSQKHKYNKTGFNARALLEKAENELHESGYDTPSHRSRNLIMIYSDEGYENHLPEKVSSLDSEDVTEETVSATIIDCIKVMTDTYRMEIWTYV